MTRSTDPLSCKRFCCLPNTKDQFRWFHAVLNHSRPSVIKGSQIATAMAIWSHWTQDQFDCTASSYTLAREAHVGRRTAQRSIEILADEGWVEVIKQGRTQPLVLRRSFPDRYGSRRATPISAMEDDSGETHDIEESKETLRRVLKRPVVSREAVTPLSERTYSEVFGGKDHVGLDADEIADLVQSDKNPELRAIVERLRGDDGFFSEGDFVKAALEFFDA